MFYCEPCRVKNQWPKGFSNSYGACEVCGKMSQCYDVQSGNLPASPQENQPGDAKAREVIILEVVYQYLVQRSEDYDSERAKRLELEKELARAVALALNIETYTQHEDSCNYGVQAGDDCDCRKSHWVAELLALRGGKGGQTDLVGPEAKDGGKSSETSASCAHCGATDKFTALHGGESLCGECFDKRMRPLCNVCSGSGVVHHPKNPVKGIRNFYTAPCSFCNGTGILGPHSEGTAADSVQSESGAPSPEPAAIPKTTKAREWWIDTRPNVFAHDIAFPYECRHTEGTNDFVHVREVTGEGRKVRAACLDWLKSMDRPFRSGTGKFASELLCVLSEEGGRQKEGGREITSASESSETSSL